MQKTPLFDLHVKLHGKMQDYHGFLLPLCYEAGVEKEKLQKIKCCGLFDACFLGELELAGEAPEATLEKVFGKSFRAMTVGKIERARLFDLPVDVYAVKKGVFMLVVLPAAKEKTVSFIRANLVGKTTLLDISNAVGAVLLQGGRANDIATSATRLPQNEFSFLTTTIKETSCIVSKIPEGVLISCNFQKIKSVYEEIALLGIPVGLLPCGVGALEE